jgi:AcrR family transcriptional regulator
MSIKASHSSTLRAKRRQFTRQAILDAALDLINEHGLYNLSLREIARRVGYSPAALYEYFDSKEAIVHALSDQGDSLLKDRLSEVPPDLPPDQRLVELGLAYIDFARKNTQHFNLIFNELSTRRTSLNDPINEEKPYYMVAKAVRDGINLGIFQSRPGFSLGEIAYGMWALAHGAASLQTTKLKGFQGEFHPTDRALFTTFIKGLQQNHEN